MDSFGVYGFSSIETSPLAPTIPTLSYLRENFQGFPLSSLECRGRGRVANVFYFCVKEEEG